MESTRGNLSLLLMGVLVLAGCTPNLAYRTDYVPCALVEARPSEGRPCAHSALQEFVDPGDPKNRYSLGFVEFDDQGQLYDRRQLQAVTEYVARAAAEDNLLLTVFVHGWHHNARAEDDNVKRFRATLARLSQLENRDARRLGSRPRRVIGVYLGWRGESLNVPGLRKLTFWDRKETAQLVGRAGAVELLARLESIRDTRRHLAGPDPARQNRLVVVGHSFGGALVYAALSQIMAERFVDTDGPPGTAGNADGFGDFVALINPAFEARQFATIWRMAAQRRTYFPDQRPLLAVMTSEADWATGMAFPAGRWLSTALTAHRPVTETNPVTGERLRLSQGAADRTALGHYRPYVTHRLDPAETPAMSMMARLARVRSGWRDDRPGAAIAFPGTALRHGHRSVARNPYLVIRVDKAVIPGHNEIDDPRVLDFLAYLIMTAATED